MISIHSSLFLERRSRLPETKPLSKKLLCAVFTSICLTPSVRYCNRSSERLPNLGLTSTLLGLSPPTTSTPSTISESPAMSNSRGFLPSNNRIQPLAASSSVKALALGGWASAWVATWRNRTTTSARRMCMFASVNLAGRISRRISVSKECLDNCCLNCYYVLMMTSQTRQTRRSRRFDSLEQEAFLNLWHTYDRLRVLEDS